MTPLYLADMMGLKEHNSLEWEYLKNNFSISKSGMSYKAIGYDQTMKKINKDMKVTSGIKELRKKPNALDRFFLAISSQKEFCRIQSIGTCERRCHYQLTGTTFLE